MFQRQKNWTYSYVASARIQTSRLHMPDGMRQGEAAMSCIQGLFSMWSLLLKHCNI